MNTVTLPLQSNNQKYYYYYHYAHFTELCFHHVPFDALLFSSLFSVFTELFIIYHDVLVCV